MNRYTKFYREFLLVLAVLFTGLPGFASVNTVSENVEVKQVQKFEKKQDRIHKKMNKIQQRIIKSKEKAGVAVLDDAGFLEGADDRVRWGLIGLAGGLLLWLILKSALAWIGWLAMVGGLGLIIWYLVEP